MCFFSGISLKRDGCRLRNERYCSQVVIPCCQRTRSVFFPTPRRCKKVDFNIVCYFKCFRSSKRVVEQFKIDLFIYHTMTQNGSFVAEVGALNGKKSVPVVLNPGSGRIGAMNYRPRVIRANSHGHGVHGHGGGPS